MSKKLNKSVAWMTTRESHAAMGRSVLQLIANPDATKADILAAAEMYLEATLALEAQYSAMSKTIAGTYLPVLTHRGHTKNKVIVVTRHKPTAKV